MAPKCKRSSFSQGSPCSLDSGQRPWNLEPSHRIWVFTAESSRGIPLRRISVEFVFFLWNLTLLIQTTFFTENDLKVALLQVFYFDFWFDDDD